MTRPFTKLGRRLLVVVALVFLSLSSALAPPAANGTTGTNYPNCGAPTVVTLAQFEGTVLNQNPDQNSLNPPCSTYYELDGMTISSTPYLGDCNTFVQGFCDVHLPFKCSVSCLFEVSATWSAAGYTYPTGCHNGTVASNVCVKQGDTVNALGFFHIDASGNHEFHSLANIVFTSSSKTDFTLSASPSVTTTVTGAKVASTITASSINGFAGTIDLSTSTSPPGPTVTLSSTSITLSSGGSAQSTLNFQSSTAGNYTVTLNGTSGTLAHNVSLNVNVKIAPDFLISPNPSFVSEPAGASASSTLALTSLNGFSGPVALSAQVSAGGFGVQIKPNNPTLASGSSTTSTITVTSPSNAVPQDYTITITGKSGSIIHTITLPLIVTGFALAINPGDLSFSTGKTGRFNVTLASLNGFSGNVTLTDQTSNNNLVASLGSRIVHVTPEATTVTSLSVTSNTNGGYTVTVIGTLGKFQEKISAAVDVTTNPDFIISANPVVLQANPGSSSTSTITATSVNGLAGNMNLNANVNAPGATVSLNPASTRISTVSPSTSTLTISVPNSVPAGLYSIVVSAQSGPTHTVTIWLFVTQPTPDYTISSSPGAQTVTAGNSASYVLTLKSLNAFSGSISLSASSNNALTSTVNPTMVTLSAGGSATANLTIATNSFTTPASYTVTISATSGFLLHTTTVALVVNGPPDFAVTANPSSLSILAGSTGKTTVGLNNFNGFSNAVNLALSSAPSTGITCTLLPTTISGQQTATISCNGTAGSYTITLTGTSGTLSHSANVAFTIQDFTITASPASVSTQANQKGTSTISLTALQGFGGLISLSSDSTSCGLAPTTVTGSGSSDLSCAFSSTGIIQVNVTGTSSNLSHSVIVTYNIGGLADFTISASPSSVTTLANATGTSMITVSATNGFAGTITLSSSASPATGLSCSLNPPTITLGTSGTSTLSCTGSAGVFTVSVSGTNGTLTHSITVSYTVQDFALTSSPATVTVNAGSSGSSTITVNSENEFNGIVNLTTNSTMCAMGPTSVRGSGNSILSCTFSSPGTFHVKVSGTSGTLSHAIMVVYNVAPTPNFAVSANPTSLTNLAGATGTSTITVQSAGGFAGTIALSDTVSPSSGLACTLSPPSVTISSTSTSGNSALSCTGSAGSYTVTVTGTSVSAKASATITYTVQDYQISANPVSVIVFSGATNTTIATITAINGFAGNVSLSANAQPGFSTLFNNNPVAAGSTSTVSISIAGNVTAGNYVVVLTGTSGNLTHSVNISVTVRNTPPIGFVTSMSVVGANSNTITTGMAFHTGDLVVVYVTVGGGQTVTSVVDSGSPSSTYTLQASAVNGNTITYLYTATAMTGSSNTITVTTSSPGNILIGADEYSGVVGVGAVSTNVGTSTTPSVSLTTQNTNSWVVVAYGWTGGGAHSGDTGFVDRQSSAFSSQHLDLGDTGAAKPIGNYTYSATIGQSDPWSMIALELTGSSISFVTNMSVAGANSNIITSGLAFHTGDLVVVYVTVGGGQTITSVTDSGSPSSTYTLQASAVNGNTITYLYTAWATTSTINAITVTTSAAGYTMIGAAEYSGVVGFGAVSTNTGTGTTPSVSLTTQHTNSWVVVAYGWTGGGAHSGDTGFVDRQSDALGNQHLDLGDTGAAKPTGNYTYSATIGQSDPWSMIALELY